MDNEDVNKHKDYFTCKNEEEKYNVDANNTIDIRTNKAIKRTRTTESWQWEQPIGEEVGIDEDEDEDKNKVEENKEENEKDNKTAMLWTAAVDDDNGETWTQWQ